MNFFSNLFNSIIGKNTNEVEDNTNNIVSNTIPKLVGPNESCIIRKFRPNFLDQGKTLHKEQSKQSDALRSSIRVMNERINNNIEGFGDMTASKNSADLSETITLSNSFDKNIERYNKEYPLFIDETRNATKLNDRNKNIKDNSSLFTNSDNNFYDITYEKEGCYKSAGAPGLELQTDLNDVSVQTCKMRASDLGYSGFAIRKGLGGQLGCYLSKDILTAKSGGIATKPVTSLAFKTSTSANMGGLLSNGQLGIYNSTIDNNLVTDLDGIQDCDIKGSDNLINENSVLATWGENCKGLLDINKKYLIKGINTSQCLVSNARNRFFTYSCGYDDQYWKPSIVSGKKNTYQFKNTITNKCLYVNKEGIIDVTDNCDINDPTQQWNLIEISGLKDTYVMKNIDSQKCLVKNKDGRFYLEKVCYAGWTDQQWNFIAV